MTGETDTRWWPARGFRGYGLEPDQLRMAAQRGNIRTQPPRSELNPSGRSRYLVRDVMLFWPECFPETGTNPNKLELSGHSGGKPLPCEGTCGRLADMQTPFVSVGRAAQMLGVPSPYLRRQIEAGSVPALRTGRGFRVDAAAARAALARVAAASSRALPAGSDL